MAICALNRPGPSADTIAIASSSAGNTSTTSIRRMITVSTDPRANPAINPRSDPMMIENPTVKKPICNETRAP